MQTKASLKTFLAASSIAAGLLLAAPAQAAVVVGGSALLATGDANQLETWLGEGAITLTNIFTKQAGDDAYDFHAAADDKGRTFVVMYGTSIYTGKSAVYGGYDPQSWKSSGTWNVTSNVADRTGFLFNLTTDQLFSQRTTPFTGGIWAGIDFGPYQTYNNSDYGPTFGRGYDIYTDFTLNVGYSFLAAYTDDNALTYRSGKSLIDGSGAYDLRISGIEVFAISAGAAVPEPGSLALAALALAGLGAVRRRRPASALTA